MSKIFKPSHVRRCVICLLCLLLAFSNIKIVCADDVSDYKKARVGIFYFDGYHMRDENGVLSGYGIEFLNMVSKYSHINFEYTDYDKTWADMLDMLENGDIDVLTSARKNPEREEKFLFSLPIGRNNTILSVNENDSRFHSGDYASYDGMRIGMLTGSSQNKALEEFAKEKGFSYQKIEYDNSAMLSDALKSGDIDAILTSNLRKTHGERTLEILESDDFYAIVRKDDRELLNEINYAIEQMDINEGDWKNNLYYKYYGLVHSGDLVFTDREREYIQDVISGKKKISVIALGDRAPYSFVEDGELKGIMPEYFDKLMELVGMPYEFVVPKDREEYYRLSNSNSVDIVIDRRTDVETTEGNTYHGFNTLTYLSVGIARVTRSDFSGEPKTVAGVGVQGDVPLEKGLIGDAEVINYATREEALQAVLDKKADAAYVYTYAAQMFVSNDLTNSLKYSVVNGIRFDFRMYLREECSHELVTILNKCIQHTSSDVFDQLIAKYTTYNRRDLSLAEYIHIYPGRVAAIILFLGLVTVIIAALVLRARWSERMIKASEHAKREVEEQLGIVDALSRDYLNIYAINTGEKTARIIKLEGYVTSGLKRELSEKFPYTPVTQRYIDERVHPDERQQISQALSIDTVIQRLSANDEYTGSYRVLVDGEVHNFQYTFVKIDRESLFKEFDVLAGFRSIDEVVRREQEQQKVLAEALAEAQRANQAKTSFLNSMSHDIRTPMNAIIGFTSLAGEQIDNRHLVENYLKKIMTSGKHLLSLINDVLDMSRIESGKVKIEEKAASIKDIMQDLNTILQSEVRAKHLKFSIDMVDVVDDTVICDRLRLNQVLLNIISNAIKYTNPGGEVSVSIRQIPVAQKGYATYRFNIRDTGIGMSEEFLKHVFEPFSREQTATVSGIQGTGLGLSITKNIIDMMNGTISVESEVGKGTEFTVSFCFATAETSEKKEVSREEIPPEFFVGKKLLLAEDNELNQEIAKAILEGAGFELDIVGDGSEAVEIIREKPEGTYDIIIMDIQMPIMNGYEATKAIRGMKDSAKSGIPILAMTADAFEEDRQKALNVGMNGHIAKPIDVPKLMQTLWEILKED